MNKPHSAGTYRFLSLSSLFCAVLALCFLFSSSLILCQTADAVTWQWSVQPQPGRPQGAEQILIRLDGPLAPQALEYSRTEAQAITLTLPQPVESFTRTGDGPDSGALTNGLRADGNRIILDTANPAFGYVLRRPGDDSILITISPDPLGARWTPVGPAATPQEAATLREAAEAARDLTLPPAPAAIPAPAPTQAAQPAQPAPQSPAQSQPTIAPAPAQQSGAPGDTGTQVQAPAAPQATQTPAGQSPAPAQALEALTGANALRAPLSGTSNTPGTPGAPSTVPEAAANAPQAPGVAPPDQAENIVEGGLVPLPAPSSLIPLPEEPDQAPPASIPPSLPAPAAGSGAPSSAAPAPVPPAPASPSPAPAADGAPQPAPAGTPPSPAAPLPAADAQAKTEEPFDVRGSISLQGPGSWVRLDDTATAPALRPDPTSAPAPVPTPAPAAPQPVEQTQGGNQTATGEPAVPNTLEASAPAVNTAENTEPQPLADPPASSPASSPAAPRTAPQGSSQSAPQTAPQAAPSAGETVAAVLPRAREKMTAHDYRSAQDLVRPLFNLTGVPPEALEEALYINAEAEFQINHTTLQTTGQRAEDAFNLALSANMKSPRAALAYARLGYIALQRGDRETAKAYMRQMEKQFPTDPYFADLLIDVADDAMAHSEFRTAMELYQRVYTGFPDLPRSRDAVMGLARSLHALEFYDQELQLLSDFTARWPEYFSEHPEFLIQIGDAYYQMRRSKEARDAYMRYINILPNGKGRDVVLARVGDTLLADNERDIARVVYEYAAQNYPLEDGGLVAKMRLAKEFSSPAVVIPKNLSEPDPVPPVPPEIYRTILNLRPATHWLVPVARLEMALWYLNQLDPFEALRESSQFLKLFPKHADVPVAQDIMEHSFSMLLSDAAQKQKYAPVVKVWNEFPELAALLDKLSPEQRLALATSFWKEDQSAFALNLLDPLLGSYKDPVAGEQALALALNIYLDDMNWPAIANLAARVAPWELRPSMQVSLTYAQALALENTGKSDQAQALWKTLNDTPALNKEQRANVVFFMAEQAYSKRDQLRSYTLYQEAYGLFKELAADNPNAANVPRIRACLSRLMDITEEAGRVLESLDWANQYTAYVPENDTSYDAHLLRLARLHQKLGEMDQWRALLQKVIDRDPNSHFGRSAQIQMNSARLPLGR